MFKAATWYTSEYQCSEELKREVENSQTTRVFTIQWRTKEYKYYTLLIDEGEYMFICMNNTPGM